VFLYPFADFLRHVDRHINAFGFPGDFFCKNMGNMLFSAVRATAIRVSASNADFSQRTFHERLSAAQLFDCGIAPFLQDVYRYSFFLSHFEPQS
jgi:hypothetical protein